MGATIAIVLLWIGFGGSHIAPSVLSIRNQLVRRLGEGPFRGLYSLVSFAFFIPLVWVYAAHKHAGPQLWSLPHGIALLSLMYVGMAVAFTLLLAAVMRPSPAAVVPGDATPTGVFRITRHPLFMGIALFALLHLLPNGGAADVAFFGGFVVFVLIGGWHQDQRKLATAGPQFARFYAATPFLPFTGTATLQGVREMSPQVIAAGVVLTVVVRYFHASLFGP